MLELRIAKLEDVLSNARVIDESQLDDNKISILSRVKLRNLKTNTMVTYELVPENESDIKQGKISVSSPVARGLLGKTAGDIAEISVPAGVLSFEVVEISR